MNKLTTEQYAAARRMIDEEIIGAFGQHRGRILDSWYERLAQVLQIPIDEPTIEEIEDIAKKISVPKLETVYLNVVEEFVRARNRINSQEDPRRKKIIDAIDSQIPSRIGHRDGYIIPSLEDCADAILAALDENADLPTTPAKRIPLYGLSMWEVSAAEKEINPVFDEIEDLLWDKIPVTDEYNDPVSNHNTLVYAGFLRGKQASVNTIKEQVTCPICVSGDTQRSNTNEHINEPKLPEGLDQLINEFARHRPNDLQIGKDFILESFRRGRDSKIS